jgi:muconolactone delta-isomerase
MKILALEKEIPGAASEDFQPFLKAEAARVWELYQSGVLRELYFRSDQHTAVLILECEGVPQAEELLRDLPLVANGLIQFEILPLAPYPGFARLFA